MRNANSKINKCDRRRVRTEARRTLSTAKRDLRQQAVDQLVNASRHGRPTVVPVPLPEDGGLALGHGDSILADSNGRSSVD